MQYGIEQCIIAGNEASHTLMIDMIFCGLKESHLPSIDFKTKEGNRSLCSASLQA
jgi:hypothetical protein